MNAIGWSLVAVAAGLGVYVCVLFTSVSLSLAQIIVNIFI